MRRRALAAGALVLVLALAATGARAAEMARIDVEAEVFLRGLASGTRSAHCAIQASSACCSEPTRGGLG